MEKINFDKHYNFDNFIVGNSNRFAYSLAVDVAKDSSRIGNVVFLYSKNGLGKTHLMHAIGNEEGDKITEAKQKSWKINESEQISLI